MPVRASNIEVLGVRKIKIQMPSVCLLARKYGVHRYSISADGHGIQFD